MEEPRMVSIDRPLSRFEECLFKKVGDRIMPELVPGSNLGTMLEDDSDVSIVKSNPTRRNWYLFLTKKGFIDDSDRLININNND